MIISMKDSEGKLFYRVYDEAYTRDYYDVDDAIRDNGSRCCYSHYLIMDELSDLEFLGRCFRACQPRFCNGSYTMFEFVLGVTEDAYWFVTTMDKRVMAVFALREQAMKYIHDKECRT